MPQRDTVNRRVILAARPRGLPTPQDFRLDEAVVPTPDEGQVLLRTLYLSLDPYMRNVMDEIGPVYAPSVPLGAPMVGGTINRVAAASGAVGAVIGQIAKLKGTRVVGIAGGADKCRYVVEDAFRREMRAWIDAGRVKLREDRVDGLEHAPAAFIGPLEGRNFGKLVVRVADA